MIQSRAIVFDCKGANLVGVAEVPSAPRSTGLLVITGGPQYRVGSHRQFTLLCRGLAMQQFASMRFDYRGSGDSEPDRAGAVVTFADLQPDIAAAIDQLLALVPEMSRVVLLGLCDGASAALMYAHTDSRVAGVVMLNPWVRTPGSLEQRSYPARLASGSFWKRLLTGKVSLWRSPGSFRSQVDVAKTTGQVETEESESGVLQHVLTGAQKFGGEILVVLSGQDMTAQEYRELIDESDQWRVRMSSRNVQHRDVAGANHTFASAQWRDAVAGYTAEFLRRLDG